MLTFGLPHLGIAQFYSFENFTAKDGLGQSEVNGICQDKFGNIWFGTQGGGLSRYDGNEVEIFNESNGLISDVIYDVAVDLEGNVWVATNIGLSSFNGTDYKNYPTQIFSAAFENRVKTIFVSSHNEVWFACMGGGVQKMSADSIINYNADSGFTNSQVSAISEDKNGNLLLATGDGDFYNFNSLEFKKIEYDLSNHIYSLFNDSNGIIWIGTEKGLVKHQSGKNKEYFDLFSGFQSRSILTINESFNGDFWLGSVRGVFKFNGHEVERYDMDKGFTNVLVNTVFRDREGSIWFGSEGRGAFRLAIKNYRLLDRSNGLSGNVVFAIKKDKKDNYWLGYSANGVDKITEGVIEHVKLSKHPAAQKVAEIAIGDTAIWFGTRGAGLFLHTDEGSKNYTTEDGLSGDYIIQMYLDTQKILWICTSEGLSRFDGKNFTNYTAQDGLHTGYITSILEVGIDSMLIGSTGGVNRLAKNTIYPFNPIGDEINCEILAIKKSLNNDIFFASYSKGIYKYNVKKDLIIKVKDEGVRKSKLIFDMVFDDMGNLLIGSETGIDKLTIDDFGDVSNIESFPIGEVNSNSILKDDNGLFWFGTVHGVAQYYQDKLLEDQEVLPTLYFSEINDFYDRIDFEVFSDSTSNWFGIPHNLELPYSSNDLSFDLKAVHIQKKDKILYSYLLDGFEDKWSPLDDQNKANYTNLPPGDYTFKAKATSDEGQSWTDPVTFSFVVLAPFYKTIWFYLLVISTGVILLFLYNRYRITTAVELERMKLSAAKKIQKQMARSFHDDLGNNLASMMVLINVVKLSINDKRQEIFNNLDQQENLAKLLFYNTKDFIWSIDPDNNNLRSTYNNLKDFLESRLENMNIQFIAETNFDKTSSAMLQPGYNRRILLVLKEVANRLTELDTSNRIFFELNVVEDDYRFNLRSEGSSSPISLNGVKRSIDKRASKAEFEVAYELLDNNVFSFTVFGKIPNKRDFFGH